MRWTPVVEHYLVGSVAVALVAAPPTEKVELRFQPLEGTGVRKELSAKSEYSVDSIAFFVNEQELQMEFGDVEFSGSNQIAVVDTCDKVADGRPTELVRDFETISAKQLGTQLGEGPVELSTSSGLEASRVQFTWDEETKTYFASYADKQGGDKALLDGLVMEMDFQSLLPPDGTAELGQTWGVPVEAIRDLLCPGGDLAVEVDGASITDLGLVQQAALGDLHALLANEMEGGIEARLKEVVESEAGNLAVIEFEFQCETSGDLTELARAIAERSGAPEDEKEALQSLEFELELDGDGELCWNLDEHRFESLELSGDQTLNTTSRITTGPEEDLTVKGEASGTLEANASATPQ